MRRGSIKSVAAIGILSLALAACGSGDEETGDAQKSGGEKTVPSANIATALTMTGFAAFFGQQQQAAVELAVEELAKQKKANLTIVSKQDTGATNATALNAFRKAVSTEPAVVIGPIIGTQVLAMKGEIQRNELPFIVTAATRVLTLEGNKYIFRNFPHSGMQMQATAQYAFDELKLSKPAILADNTAFGQGDAEELKKQAAERGITIAADESVDPTAVDVTGQVSRIIRSGADSVFVQLLTGAPLATAIKTLRRSGFEGEIFAAPGLSSPSTLDLLSNSDVENVYSPGLSLDTSKPATKAFADAFQAKFNRPPDIYAATMYDSVMLVGEVVADGHTEAADILAELPKRKYTGVAQVYQADQELNLAHTVSVLKFDAAKKASAETTIDLDFEPFGG